MNRFQITTPSPFLAENAAEANFLMTEKLTKKGKAWKSKITQAHAHPPLRRPGFQTLPSTKKL